jgi:hypothetical protein
MNPRESEMKKNNSVKKRVLDFDKRIFYVSSSTSSFFNV